MIFAILRMSISRLSQAQMLWGFYHIINIDFAYLIWEDFVYQVEHKNQKRSNEMNYPRFTKVIIDYFMIRKPSISRRNRINWHYVRDDALFSTIKVVSRHQTTQQYGAILPIELTTAEIRNSKAYKEYHACAMGEAAPKLKASARKKKGDSASSTTPPTSTPTTIVESAPRLSATAKGKQPSRATTPVEPTDVQRTEAEQLKIVLKRSRHETISRRNRINWHYVRDDALFSTIEVVSRHQTTQQYGVILPIELTTDEIRNSKAYKEYYACAMGEATPKPKASARKKNV
nr:hypothetical protein [Tanacetum cinerariifolium]